MPSYSVRLPEDLQALRQQWLMEHHRLGHPSQKRQAALDIDGLTKPKVPKLACPTCLASKARKSNRPPPTQKEERSHIPWEDIHSDLSGKIATQSAGIQVLRSLRMHLHRRQTRGIPLAQEPLHSRIPSPGHGAGRSSANTTHRPRHGISQ